MVIFDRAAMRHRRQAAAAVLALIALLSCYSLPAMQQSQRRADMAQLIELQSETIRKLTAKLTEMKRDCAAPPPSAALAASVSAALPASAPPAAAAEERVRMVLHPTHIGVATSASQAAPTDSPGTLCRRRQQVHYYTTHLKGSTEFNAMAIEAQMSQLRAVGFTPSLVLDVGANDGESTREFLEFARAPPASQLVIHSFEPVPKTFARLRENTRRNVNLYRKSNPTFLVNVTLHNIALNDHEGTIEFFSGSNRREGGTTAMASINKKGLPLGQVCAIESAHATMQASTRRTRSRAHSSR